MSHQNIFFNIKGKLIDFTGPIVMGILNLTPDSFHSDSRVQETDLAVKKAGQMISEGAAILDLGAASTRPGSTPPEISEEWNRLVHSLRKIRIEFPDILISVDTFRAEIARLAIEEGADIINDISGASDPEMFRVLNGKNVAYVLTHIQGTPETMQMNPTYADVCSEVLSWMFNKVNEATDAGVKDIIIDVGFGFGKTIEHNFQLMRNLEMMHIPGCPLLVGISRKGMIWKSLGIRPEDALNGTTALHMTALGAGAGILRVHDVKEARECIKLYEMLNHA